LALCNLAQADNFKNVIDALLQDTV